jgi:predicted porin
MLSRSTQDTTASGTAASVGRTGNYKEYQFGVRYDLSKRTLLYVMSGQSKDTSTTGDGAGLRKRNGTAAGLYMSF